MQRFVSSAAENGIDVFRLHDPLNDVTNLREAGEAITGAGKEFHAGLVYSPGRTGEAETLEAQARKLPDLGATRVLLNDPTGALAPHRVQSSPSAWLRRADSPSASTCKARSAPGSPGRSPPRRPARTSSPAPSTRSR